VAAKFNLPDPEKVAPPGRISLMSGLAPRDTRPPGNLARSESERLKRTHTGSTWLMVVRQAVGAGGDEAAFRLGGATADAGYGGP